MSLEIDLTVPPDDPNSLKGFQRFNKLLTLDFHPNMYHMGTTANINLLSARVKVAKCFRGIDLEGYSDETQQGYNAFFKVFLVHSALEMFAKSMRRKRITNAELAAYLETYNGPDLSYELCASKEDKKLWGFIHSKVNTKTITDKLNALIEENKCECFYLSAGLRHIFAHGHLTPNVGGVKPKRVKEICTAVSDLILHFIDSEFDKKMNKCWAKEENWPGGLTRRLERKAKRQDKKVN